VEDFMKKGSFLKTRTKTMDDVFGEVLWEVTETGLPAPEKERKGQVDGVKCVMIGGTGPSARKGYTVVDSEAKISLDIAAGITTVISDDKKAQVLAVFSGKKADGEKVVGRAYGSGCVELE
jgi:hypothetical protein